MKLTRTEQQCPEVWEGYMDDGREVFVRERHGRVTVKITPNSGQDVIAFHGEAKIGDIVAAVERGEYS